MPGIIQTIALCWYEGSDTGSECCFTKFTLNKPPRKKAAYQMTRCNGECGREQCSCIVLRSEDVIPRPPYTLADEQEQRTSPPKRRAGIKKPIPVAKR